MKPSTLFRLAAVGLTIFGTAGAIVACSSSSPQVTPPGEAGTTTEKDSGSTKGKDSGTTEKDSGTTEKDSGSTKGKDSGTKPSDSGSGSDVEMEAMGLPDVGTCKSDSSVCNSCFAPVTADSGPDVQVPLNACSSAVGNCLPFTGTVPTGAP